MAIRVYIVDDHQVFREGIISLFSFEEDIEVVGGVGSIQAFKEKILSVDFDVLLMDISLKDGEGTEGVTWLKEQRPDAKVLMLSMHRESKFVKKVIACGANGFLLKDAGTDEMMRAVRLIHQGETFYSQQLMGTIVDQLGPNKKMSKNRAGTALTKRETEVLKLIAEERNNKEIADLLFISIRTVDTHKRNLLDKLQVKNTAGLVKYALRNGIIEL